MTTDSERNKTVAKRIRNMAEAVQSMSDEELEKVVGGIGASEHQYPDPVLQGAIDRAQGSPYS